MAKQVHHELPKACFALQHLFGELTPLVNTPGLAELLHNLSKRQS
jgi:hypothetical protein